MSRLPDFLNDDASLRTLIESFEAGVLPLDQWHHATHLAICTWYILNDNFPLTRLRHGIRHYVECQDGVNGKASGYHESLTQFWLRVVTAYVQALPKMSTLQYARAVVHQFGRQKNLWREYYAADGLDLIASEDARVRWIPPSNWEIR